MKPNKKQKIIFAALLGALCTGVAGAALLSPVTAENASAGMLTLIGETTENVTPSATNDGLMLTRADATKSWSAQLNSVFTGTTSIEYRLLNRSGDNWKNEVNAFTVKNFYGEEVARFIIGSAFWGNIVVNQNQEGVITSITESNKAFVYNALTGEYTTAGVVDEKVSGYITLDESKNVKTTFTDWKNAPFYCSPSTDISSKYPATTDLGTVTFEYKNGTLTIKTSTFDLQGINDDDKTKVGNGQTVALGEVEANLDQGYTITVGSATDLPLSDGSLYSYEYSSNVRISAINGVSAKGATLSGDAAKSEEIVYYGAEAQGEGANDVIYLYSGEKLNKFYYREQTVYSGENGNSLGVAPVLKAFDYAQNKEFTETEEITVSYGELQKSYTVQTNASLSVKTKELIAETSAASLTVGSGIEYTTKDGENATQKGLLVSGDKKGSWKADFNGTFSDTTTISYFLTEMTSFDATEKLPYIASSFMICDLQGNKVADFVVLRSSWGTISGNCAYVYNAQTKKYTTQLVGWQDGGYQYKGVSELIPTTQNAEKPVNGFNSFPKDMYVSPCISTNALKTDEIYGTVTFEYANGKLTIKTSTYDVGGNNGKTGANYTGQGQTITVGEIDVDLSAGYKISLGSAPAVPYSDGGEFNYLANSPFLLVKLNGQDVTGADVQATQVRETISADNVNDNGVIELEKGESPVFSRDTEVFVGGMNMKKTAYTAQTMYGAYEEYGDEGVISVKGTIGRKDFAVRVKTLAETLEGVEMQAGASIRTKEPYGIRFQMNVTAEAKQTIEENVGEGKAYQSVKYGMMILPYSYIAAYGGLTEENLFGANAVYTWNGKAGAGTTEIMLKYSENNLVENKGDYVLWYSSVNLTGEAITAKFVGAGFIEFTRQNGTKDYKIVTRYDGYEENAANTNVRSCYDVAVAAYEDESEKAPAAEVKQWLYDNYLKDNGYEAEGGNE